MRLWLLLLLEAAAQAVVQNKEMLLDMFQINPGDSIGNQGSKYTDVEYLKSLGYTGRSSSVEQSPAFCLNFSRATRTPRDGVFRDRPTLAWINAYCESMKEFIEESHAAGLEVYFHTDMVVFPKEILRLFPEVLHPNTTSTIVWNPYTIYLIEIMMEEWFSRFPGTNGIVIRTGETYVFDTPYHLGSSPVKSALEQELQNRIWVQFLTLLRKLVCVKYQRKLIFRTWDSISGADAYINITSKIEPHEHFYFAVKYTSGDFFRQMSFNPILNQGQHAQIVEIQIQREYEGKGAYPLYLFEHVVLHDNTIPGNRSLSKVFAGGRNSESIVKGLWTWSRGGGWWGPYIHSAEFWIDLNLNMFVSWWRQNCTTTADTVPVLFRDVCRDLLLNDARKQQAVNKDELDRVCNSMHQIARLSDEAMVHGRYCLEVGQREYWPCLIWTRDDRLGGYDQLQAHMGHFLKDNDTRIEASLWYKQRSIELWKYVRIIFDDEVTSLLKQWNYRLYRQIRSSILYAQCYFCVIESGWRAMIYGKVKGNRTFADRSQLHAAIHDYDVCWQSFKGLSIGTPEFPSIYHGEYWNWPFQNADPGLDETIAKLRLQLDYDFET